MRVAACDYFESNIMNSTEGPLSTLEKLIQSQSSEKSIHAILSELGVPFASVGILENGRITAKVIGTNAGDPSHSRLNEETLFQAASISKPLTAMAVVKLSQDEKLDLDCPISEYLNQKELQWISTQEILKLASQITLRQLLSHTSGLSCNGFMGYPTSDVPTIKQILRGNEDCNNEEITMSFLPAQAFHYSGGGYTVVQLILETRFEKPFYKIMDEIILAPLNMTRSTFRFLPAAEKNYASAHANGSALATSQYHFFPESAAAGLWTTPTDLLKLIHAMQRSLESDDRDNFLWRCTAREMLTQVGGLRCMGWDAKKGEAHFGHAGSNDPGYYCYVGGYAAIPKNQYGEVGKQDSVPSRTGLCVMTSSMLGKKVVQKLVTAIAYLKGWPTIPDMECVPFMDKRRGQHGIPSQATEYCDEWGPDGALGFWCDDDNGEKFSAHFKDISMPVVPGAIPAKRYERQPVIGGVTFKETSADLVIDGLEVMLRLGWKENTQVLEVWQDGGVRTLKSKSSSRKP